MRLEGYRRLGRRGFTLVEMLIVLGILVLMFAMVVPRFLGSQKKAKLDLAASQIGSFRAALEHYYLDCDGFPTTEQGLAALASRPADLADRVTWRGPYVSGQIAADPWGNPYNYEYPPTHGTDDLPDIWSSGPDGEEGSEDDICSWSGGAAADGGEASATGEAPVKEPSTRGAKGAPTAPRPKASAGPRPSAAPTTPKATAPSTPKAVRSDNP